jgi:pSer/pThr/pTyr-binding forkhead associated (FHA) protein
MSAGVEITVVEDGEIKQSTFARLPIRLGRDPSCDLVLSHPFVSRCHARVEARGDEVFLIDDGSANGLVHRGARLAPHTPVRIGPEDEVFLIDNVSLSVRSYEVTELAPPAVSEMESTDPLLAGSYEEMRTSLYAERNVEPCALDDVQRLLDGYRDARRDTLRALRAAIEATAEHERAALVRQVAASLDDLAHDPALQALLHAHGFDVIATPPDDPPARTFEDTPDAWLFFRTKTALRAVIDGLAQLEGATRVANSADALASAELSAELFAQLVDWSVGEPEAAARLVGTVCASIRARYEGMVTSSQLATVNAMHALSPQAVEKAVVLPWWNPFRMRALWRSYVARYAQIADQQLGALWAAHCERHIQEDAARDRARVAPMFATGRPAAADVASACG